MCSPMPKSRLLASSGFILRGVCLGLSIFLGALLPCFAENTPSSLPSNLSPGAIIKHNTQPWALPNEAGIPDIAPKDPVIGIEKPAAPNVLPDNTRVPIDDIQLEGVTLLPQKDVHQIVEGYRGKDLLFSDMQALADRLSELYYKRGFLNSEVYIPPQSFSNRVLILRAIETKTGTLELEKSRWFSKRAIRPQIGLKEGEPLNINRLQNNLLLINRNPDIKLQAVLSPGNLFGSTDVTLKPYTRFPVHLNPAWDNLGRKGIGVQRYGASVTHNNLLGFGDTDMLAVTASSSSLSAVNQYRFPVGSRGTQVGMDYALSITKPQDGLEDLNVRSTAQIFSPLIFHPLRYTRTQQVTAYAGLDFKNLNTELLGQNFSRDRLRVLRGGLQGQLMDRFGSTNFLQEAALGFDWLGATTGNETLASKTGSGSQFFRLTTTLTRIQTLPKGFLGVVRINSQITPDRLPSAEQIQMGGAFTVRGYKEGRYIGDGGYGVSTELYIPNFLVPATLKMPRLQTPVRQWLQWVTFIEGGQVFTHRPVAGESRHESLLGIGFGLRLRLTRFVIARLDVGFPLLRANPDSSNPRLHFGLESALF
ncbi:MAG: ShlB/FhaC/HecB family hemolysin secretion/activation protein [Vampirovibrionales bacterium]|nr:ShlB/FhaC/HecB family hemolysin secretion/activation protein [Vampirovibrionales bacterium]